MTNNFGKKSSRAFVNAFGKKLPKAFNRFGKKASPILAQVGKEVLPFATAALAGMASENPMAAEMGYMAGQRAAKAIPSGHRGTHRAATAGKSAMGIRPPGRSSGGGAGGGGGGY